MWRLSAADLAKLIKSKEVSAKQAATAALARLDAVNPGINAVVSYKPADALAQASAVDAAIARGEQLGELVGVDGMELPMAFYISMGMRRGDKALLQRLNDSLERNHAATLAILAAYHVPVLPEAFAVPGSARH